MLLLDNKLPISHQRQHMMLFKRHISTQSHLNLGYLEKILHRKITHFYIHWQCVNSQN